MRSSAQRMRQPENPKDVLFDDRLKSDISLYGRDRGTPERWRHAVLVEAGSERAGTRHARNLWPCPLDRYHQRKLLSACPFPHKQAEENEQRYEAALRFLGAWEEAGRQPRMTANFSAGAPLDRVSGQLIGGFERWKLWGEAYVACGRYAGIVQAVVCFDQVASDFVRQKNQRIRQPQKLGLARLRLGLGRLAKWYVAVDKGARR